MAFIELEISSAILNRKAFMGFTPLSLWRGVGGEANSAHNCTPPTPHAT